MVMNVNLFVAAKTVEFVMKIRKVVNVLQVGLG